MGALKKLAVLAALAGAAYYGVSALDLAASPAASVFRKFVHARAYGRDAEARGLAESTALEAVRPWEDSRVRSVDVRILSEAASSDGLRVTINGTIDICNADGCQGFRQAAVVCQVSAGVWRVCSFQEYPGL